MDELAVIHVGHVRISVQSSRRIHVSDIDRTLVAGRIDEDVEGEGQVRGQVLQEDTGLINELGIVLCRKCLHNVSFQSVPERAKSRIRGTGAGEYTVARAMARTDCRNRTARSFESG